MEMTKPESQIFRVAGLGELIWDLLPTGKRLGGAPSNFAHISALLGDEAVIASRVGNDQLGIEALTELREKGIPEHPVQRDVEHPTGTVGVSIGEHGEPNFLVNENSAWDYLEFTPTWQTLAAQMDAVCFGTLGQRNPKARETIMLFLEATRPECLRIFDVNLRHSFFTRPLLEESLRHSTIVKLNHEEILQVGDLLNSSTFSEAEIARLLLRRFKIELVAITRGPDGCALITKADFVEHPGFKANVVDTIGAGDAFTAMLVHLYLRDAPLQTMAEEANRIGAWITSQSGATPKIKPADLRQALETLTVKY
jgi:fructokinase